RLAFPRGQRNQHIRLAITDGLHDWTLRVFPEPGDEPLLSWLAALSLLGIPVLDEKLLHRCVVVRGSLTLNREAGQGTLHRAFRLITLYDELRLHDCHKALQGALMSCEPRVEDDHIVSSAELSLTKPAGEVFLH